MLFSWGLSLLGSTWATAGIKPQPRAPICQPSPAGLPPHMISCTLKAFWVLEACLIFSINQVWPKSLPVVARELHCVWGTVCLSVCLSVCLFVCLSGCLSLSVPTICKGYPLGFHWNLQHFAKGDPGISLEHSAVTADKCMKFNEGVHPAQVVWT